MGLYRSEPGRNSRRSAEQIAREQHAVRVALSSDGSEIQQVDNLHLRGDRNLCYESCCVLDERPDNILYEKSP